MREERRARRGMGWLSVAVVALVMVGTFFLAGGLGLSRNAAPLAVKQSYANGNLAYVTSITIANSCASSPTISGQVTLNKNATGSVRVGLFYLSQDIAHQFNDTGQRATATFSNASSASYAFAPFAALGNSPAYLIRVVSGSQNILVASYFTQSLAIPVCQPGPTKTVTATTTATKTNTVTATGTTTATVTSTTTASGTTTTETTTTTATAPGTTTTETTTSTATVVSTALITLTSTEYDTTTDTVTYTLTTTSPTTTTETVTSTVLNPTTTTETITTTRTTFHTTTL